MSPMGRQSKPTVWTAYDRKNRRQTRNDEVAARERMGYENYSVITES